MDAGDQGFDYIIIGAGSAGCVLANRLSADPNVRVALIEAGPTDQSPIAKLLINIPAGIFGTLGRPQFNYMYNYEADPRIGNKPIYCPRGRVLGGSSAINGMIYIRGHRRDYQRWVEAGADGWGYDEVLPYFKKSENWEGGESAFHGHGGELNVADPRDPHPVNEAMMAAAEELQFRRNDDFNGAEQEGFGYWQLTQKNGERQSTSRVFLHPVEERPNLTVITDALAKAIRLEGRKATGVDLLVKGQPRSLNARGEVIVAAGAINSPQVLLLSGIGPGAELQKHGIPVRHELPGVGENLHDHTDILVCYSSPQASLYGLSWKALPWMIASPFQYAFGRRGPWTTNTVESGGFVRSLPDLPQPDLQIILGPQYMNQNDRLIPLGHGFSVHISLLQPKSRGRLALNSGDPAAPPRLISNFLSDPDDAAGLARGVQITRRLVASSKFDSYRGTEVLPGPDIQSEKEITDFVYQNVGTTFHPAGSCKMGKDPMAVVDPQLRVHGLEGLRVVDASVMPNVISGNTNAPVIMIAERAADFIRRDWAQAA